MKYMAVFLLLISTSVSAEAEIDKRFSIGVGTYSSIIVYDESFAKDDELDGFSISMAYAITEFFALRGTYFSLEHNDLSELESSGYDLLGHLGVNMALPGFKAYIGGGLFKDKWELGSFDETFDGIQLSGGIGYNWEHVALDFILNVRDAGDYEDFVNQSSLFPVTAGSATGSLLLSFRF